MTVAPPPEGVDTERTDPHKRALEYMRAIPALMQGLAALLIAVATVWTIWFR